MKSFTTHSRSALQFAVVLLVVFTQFNLAQPQVVQAAPAPEPVRPRPLTANALPSVTLSVPAQVLLGSNVNFTATFDNTGADASDTGYGPFIDLIIPTPGTDGVFPGTPAANTYDGLGISTITASYLSIPFTTSGASQNMWILSFDGAGHATHPLLRNPSGTFVTVNGTPGAKLVVLKLPFGSFTFNQPPVTVNVSVDMSNLADVGTPLTIQARGGYQFGYTPEDDFCCGDNPVNSLSGFTPASVTPILWTLTKTYSGPENEAASGPNFRTFYPMRYTVSAAIAPGQSVTNLKLIDTLPGNLQFYSWVGTNPGGANCLPINSSSPGGIFTCDFGAASISGTASMTFDFYIPLNDDTSPTPLPVIDAGTGAAATSCNNASSSADWTPIDTRDLGATITQDPAGCEHTLNDRSIAVQKSSILVGGGNLAPKKVIEYTLNFQVSDFFAFDNVQLTDILSDGQRLDTSVAPTLSINGNNYILPAAAITAANYDINCYYTTSVVTTTGVTPGTECENIFPVDSSNPDQYGTTQIVFKISNELVTRGQNSILFGGCVNPNPASPNVLNCDPGNGGYNNGATSGTITFRAIVQENFSDNFPSHDPSVDEGDTLTNIGKYVQGEVQHIVGSPPAWAGTGGIPTDDSNISRSINTGTMTKSLYALDSVTNPALWPKDSSGKVRITPGDTVTYRIEYNLPTSDEENLEFKDYLPLPIFSVSDPQQTGGPAWTWIFDAPAGSPPSATIDASVPASGHAKFGPADTFYNYSGQATSTPATPMLPVLTDNVPNNMLDFYYGDFNDTRHQAKHVDLLFTVTVSDIPFADGLYLTNEAHGIEGSTNSGEIATSALIQVVLGEPVLVSKKSVVWTSKTVGATINPAIGNGVTFHDSSNTPRWTGTINSTYLGNHPINSNISGVDAADIVTFAIVIQNTGSSLKGAFDIQIKDDLPAQFQYPGNNVNNLNLQVYYGDGTGSGVGLPIAYNGLDTNCTATTNGNPCGAELFGSGIQLVDPVGKGVCQGHDPNLNNDIILITFDLQLKNNVKPGNIINTESLLHYAGEEGGPNYLAQPQTDTATTTVNTNMAKTLVKTEINNSPNVNAHNDNTQAVIGELITYQVQITVPEGLVDTAQIVDTLDSGLAFVDIQSVAYSPGVTSTLVPGTGTSPANVTIGGAGGGLGNLVTINFGTITDSNFNTNNTTPDTVTVVYEAVVLNVAGNQGVIVTPPTPATLLNNSAVYSWTGGSVTRSAPNITVIESDITTHKTAAGTTFDAGDTVTYTVTLTNTGGNGTDAFDVTWSDVIPANMNYVTNSLLFGTCPATTKSVNQGSAPTLTASISQILYGESCQLTYQAIIVSTVNPGQLIPNNAQTQWTSLSGDFTSTPRSTYNSGSVERTGAGGLNDYHSQDSVGISVAAVGITKQIIRTSDTDTSGNNVTIGEVITYGILLTVPEGITPSDQVVDTLPAGLALVSGSSQVITSAAASSGLLTADFNGSFAPVTINEDTTPGANKVTFPFGTINTAPDNITTNNTILLQYRAVVLNISVNRMPADIRNSATNQENSGPVSTPVVVIAPIVESKLTITKSASDYHPAQGEVVTFTLTVKNDSAISKAGAFDLVVTDVLPSDLTLDLKSIAIVPNGATGVKDNSSGNTVSVNADFLPVTTPASTLTITFKATVISPYNPVIHTITNIADVTWTSLPGTDTNERTGAEGVSGPLNNYAAESQITLTQDRNLTKGITSSTSTIDLTHARIGDILTYQVVLYVPPNTSNDKAIVVDNLPSGLAFVDCLTTTVPTTTYEITAETDITSTRPAFTFNTNNNCAGGTTAGSMPLVENSGSKLTFDFGTISNGSLTNVEKITITYRAVVLDIASNVNNVTLNNNATWTWGNGNTSVSAGPVTVQEAKLEIVKTVDPAIAIRGSMVTFTIKIDHSSSSTAAAYDALLTDGIPSGMTLVPSSIVVKDSAGIPSHTITPSATQFSVYWAVFPLHENSTITFTATYDGPGAVVNAANTQWSSIQIDPGPHMVPRSTFNLLSTERRYSPTNSAVDNYFAASSAEIRGPKGLLTGFAPGQITLLPPQPEDEAYQDLGNLWLEVPRLGLKLSIVGIPLDANGDWDLTWLSDQAGYLDGTAYPTHAGNSVITGHVYMADGTPGPFVNLHTLQYGDQIIVHLNGQSYIFEVRSDVVTSPDDNSGFKHEIYPWLTLITCKDYEAATNTYAHRVVVRAVLMKINTDSPPSTGR